MLGLGASIYRPDLLDCSFCYPCHKSAYRKYRVTYQVVTNLLLTSKQKLCFGLARPDRKETFVLKSTGGSPQPDVSPCIVYSNPFPNSHWLPCISITFCISLAFQLSWTFLFILAAGRRGNTAQKDLPLPKEDQASDNELHFVTRQKKLPITRRKGKSRREEGKILHFHSFYTQLFIPSFATFCYVFLSEGLLKQRSTRRGCYLEKRFVKQFSESSPCLPGQQGSCSTNVELSENCLQNLFSK